MLDRDLMRDLGGLGLIAPELPERYGGSGASHLLSGVVMEEISRADLSFSYIPLLASLNGQVLASFARERLAAEWLPRILAGEAIVALALTEPKGGSDAASLALKMERRGDHYVLNGEKTSISAADQADAAVVFARTGAPSDRAKGISAIFVPMNLPGISTARFHDHGQHRVGRSSIFFDEVHVPADHLLGAENEGFRQIMQGFDFSRSLIGLQCLGAAAQSLEETWAYVAERRSFDKPLVAFQAVSHPLAEFQTKVEAARLQCYNALWLKDQKRPHTVEAAMSKWWAPIIAYEAIHCCLLMHGHEGYSSNLPFERRLRDVLGMQIGDGTANIMKTIIARHSVGRGIAHF